MMKASFSRRDFLKLTAFLPLGYLLYEKGIFAHPVTDSGFARRNSSRENVLIVVFDAWSASNISLYGYGRETTPNLNRLAEKAIVYHNHFAAGNFTIPGTASILTGTLPWTHRALGLNDWVDRAQSHKNFFHSFRDYHRLAYSHNPLANRLLYQKSADIDDFTWWEKLYLNSDYLYNSLFRSDEDIAAVGLRQSLKQLDGYSYSLYLSRLYAFYKQKIAKQLRDIAKDFPLGLPNHEDYAHFILEDAIDWLGDCLVQAPQPFIGYYHFFPPHDRYHTRADFYARFAGDGFRPPDKPRSIFADNKAEFFINEQHQAYDEFILYVDSEFARLYDFMEQQGLLENTWIVLTSDHGEMFERGILGHITKVLYRPVINVPLLIFPPGQTTRVDVHAPSSSIDLLPTLMQVTGQEIPGWAEGNVLFPFAKTAAQTERDVFAFHGSNQSSGSITAGTAMIVRNNLKLVLYSGYKELPGKAEKIELFDIFVDPEELDDLYPTHKDIAEPLLETLKSELAKANVKLS